MPRVQAESYIPIPPLALWELMRNLTLRPKWDASILQVSRDELNVGKASSHLHYVAPLMLGLQWKWEGEYVSFQAPTRTSIRMVKGSFFRPFRNLVGSWVLQPKGYGTQLKLVVSFEPRFRFPFWGPLMTSRLRSILQRSLKQLQLLTTKRGDTYGLSE